MKSDIILLKQFSQEIKKLILEISYHARVGHVGSALSVSDLIAVLYYSCLKIKNDTAIDPDRDRFILSKGHAAAALYAVLYKCGLLSREVLLSFGAEQGGLCEHPIYSDRGIEMTAGSLGYGLGYAVGIAYALQKRGKKSRVYVLISDGECGEGSVWEAALLAARLELDNLTLILDYNNWQCFGRTEDVTRLEPLSEKWQSFGWRTNEIDGHSVEQILKAYLSLPIDQGRPSILIARTISGQGVSCMEDQQIAHYKVLSEKEYHYACQELIKKYEEGFYPDTL